MKSPFHLLYTALIAALVLFVLSGYRLQPSAGLAPQPVHAAAQTTAACDTGRSIQVSGAAVVYVIPDLASIQLGVQTNGATPQGTQQANFEALQRVIQAVRALGVESKDIATDRLIVYPVYDNYDSLIIKGYRVTNTVSITLRDVDRAGQVVVAALQAGANRVHDVQFYTSELRKVRDQARALAMQAAGEKAAALAETAGAQTGCVLTISENTWSQYYGSWSGAREMNLWAQNVIQNAPSGEPSQAGESPVNLGQIGVRAEVNASYAIQ